jgi:hypothetical protein
MKAPSHFADRISTNAILLGGALGGTLVFVAALPLALSSPFPTPREGEWVIDNPAFNTQAAATQAVEPPLVLAALDDSGDPHLTFTERWNLRVPQAAIHIAPEEAASVEELEPAPEPASGAAAALTAPEGGSEARRHAAPPVKAAMAPPPKRTAANTQDLVDQYLWEVYQRKPVKSDSTGDFTWKDQAAAKRLGISLRSYVIGGMDPDFREQLYHAGHAMDANGIRWSMLSAFRDDYRQGLAAGFKAHGGNSQHGGSRATGGYGHGRAIDIANAEGDGEAVWHWIDAHGAKYGLLRPMPKVDPAHIQPRSSFHDLAHDLREARLKLENKLSGAAAKVATK